MPLVPQGTFSFLHVNQVNTPNVTEATLKTQWDTQASELKTTLNNLITALGSVTAADSGADNIGADAIADITGTTIGAQMLDLRNRLKAITDGESGADYIAATAVAGLTGGTVQALIESIKTYIDGFVSQTANLADNAVTTIKIQDLAVTAAKIADLTITATKIADGTITGAKIATDTITSTNIAASAVGTSELAAGAVTAAKLATGAVDTAALGSAAVTGANIATDTITGANIANFAIGTNELAASSVTASKIQEGTLDYLYFREAELQSTTALDSGARLIGSETITGVTGTTVYAQLANLKTLLDAITPNAIADGSVLDVKLSNTAGQIKDRVAIVEGKLTEAATLSTTIKHGLNAITTTQATLLNATIKGVTRVDILGKDGNCESLTPFTIAGTTPTISTTRSKSGTSSIRFAPVSSSSYGYKDYNYPLDSTKRYVAALWVYIESWTQGDITIQFYDVGTFTAIRYSVNADTATIGSWQLIYVKIPTANTLVGTGFRMLVGSTAGNSTLVAHVDDIRLYELSSTDYTAIGTTYTATTTPSIDDFIPYVDSVKHLNGVGVSKIGKNMLPPFTEWTLHANAVVTEPYKLTLNATANSQNTDTPKIPALPSTAYTLSVTKSGGSAIVVYYDANNTYITEAANPTTFTTPSNTAFVVARMSNGSNGAGTFTFTNPMLNLGSTAETFEVRNDDYLFLPTTLASSVDRTVYDEVFYRDGAWWKSKRWMTDVVLDGSLAWVFESDKVGYKRVYADNLTTGAKVAFNNSLVVKYDGKVLTTLNSVTDTSSDQTFLDVGLDVYLTISDTDSGFGETYTPLSAEMKAYFYGWKMNNGTFGTAYNGSGTKTWTTFDATSNTGSVTVTPTTQAGGYTPYSLSYQLAKTVTEQVADAEGAIALHAGGNQVELFEGVVIRERITAQTSTSVTSYFINNVAVGSGVADAPFKNRVNKILEIYKNGQVDKKWFLASSGAYGNQRGYIPKSDFDTTAEYTVTYIILDKYLSTVNAIDVTGSYQSNIGSVVSENVQAISDINTAVSVIWSQYARKGAEQFYAATLLNSWVNYNTLAYSTAAYFKDQFDVVHLKGRIKNGTVTAGLELFRLPAGYRPKLTLIIPVICHNGTTLSTSYLEVNETTGAFVLGAGIQNTWLSLDGISFKGEQ